MNTRNRGSGFACARGVSLSVSVSFAASLLLCGQLAQAMVTLTTINTDVPGPVGIGYQPGSPDYLVVSVNFATGLPNNFSRLSRSGSLAALGSAAGFPNEIHLCVVRTAYAGFQAGDVFCGNGAPGTIARIQANGTAQNSWCVLRTATQVEQGHVWGVCIDDSPTRVFGGDLIAATDAGGVWRVNASGVPSLLGRVANAGIPVPLESCVVVPNDTVKYGTAWAGKILSGSDGAGDLSGLYLIAANGTYLKADIRDGQGQPLDLAVEDVDLIPSGEALFVADYGTMAVSTAGASQFTGMIGDFLITIEGDAGSTPAQLYSLRYTSSQYRATQQFSSPGAFEHSTFAPFSVTVTPPTVTVTAPDPLATENDPSDDGTFTFWRTGGTKQALTVNFTVSGTAQRNVDYELRTLAGQWIGGTSVTIDEWSDQVTINVVALYDGVPEPTETVILTLAYGAYTIGSPSSATVYIADLESDPTVIILAEDPGANEPADPNCSGDAGAFRIYRGGRTDTDLVVNYSPSGTATFGSDYTLDPLPIQIYSGERYTDLWLWPSYDAFNEVAETAVLSLTAGTGYRLGTPASATVTIYDPPVVTVSASIPAAAEAGLRIGQFRFSRTGNLTAELTVYFELPAPVPLPPGRALYGSDYLLNPPYAGYVTIGAGMAEAGVNVEPLQDSRNEGTENVLLNLLLSECGGYTLGSPSSATVTIEDNDAVALPVSYTITPIRSGTGYPSYGYGINNPNHVCGQGVGYQVNYSGFRWINGTFTFLATAMPGTHCAYGINDSDVIVGQLITTSNYQLPVRWVGTTMTVLNNIQSSYYGAAIAIANDGTAVGSSRTLAGVWRAARWNAGGIAVTDLRTLGGADPNVTSYAYGLNIAGRVVGKSQLWQGSVFHGYRTLGGVALIDVPDDLGTANGPDGSSEATAINLLDEVVGGTDTPSGQYHAFWKGALSDANDGFLDLGVLAGGNRSLALAINSVGHVVGNSRTTPTGGDRAFICYNNFNGTTQTMKNLNTLLSNPTGWLLTRADEISSNGWIAGCGTYNGTPTAFVLAPNF